MSTKKDKLNSVPGSLAEMPTAPISDPVVIYLQHKYPAKYTSGWATLPWPAAHTPPHKLLFILYLLSAAETALISDFIAVFLAYIIPRSRCTSL